MNRQQRARQKLLKQATRSGLSASRRVARRTFRKSTLGQLAAEASRLGSGRGSQRRMEQMGRRVEQLAGRGVLREIESQGGVAKYAASFATRLAMQELFRALGPLGSIFGALMESQRKTSSLQRQLDTAVKFLEAFGYTTISPAARRKNRKLDAALQALEEEEAISRIPKARPKPEEEPRRPAVWEPCKTYTEPSEKEVEAFGRETKTSKSSNVFSFSYNQESQRAGTLYVTFKPWWPGQKGKRPNQRGPMYAYFDVPPSKFREFLTDAKNSAGSAVWDYLRQRGTMSGHQYDYRLMSAKGAATHIPVEGGQYVPRKITPLGYVPRKGIAGFSLPGRAFIAEAGLHLNRGRPNRAFPDRAEPNTGR